jgi:hypothetical protein
MRRTCIVGAVAVVLTGCSTSIHGTATSVPSSAIAATTAGSSPASASTSVSVVATTATRAQQQQQPGNRTVVVTTTASATPSTPTGSIATGQVAATRVASLNVTVSYVCLNGVGTVIFNVTHETTGAEYGPTAAQTVLCSGQPQTLTFTVETPSADLLSAGDHMLIEVAFKFQPTPTSVGGTVTDHKDVLLTS